MLWPSPEPLWYYARSCCLDLMMPFLLIETIPSIDSFADHFHLVSLCVSKRKKGHFKELYELNGQSKKKISLANFFSQFSKFIQLSRIFSMKMFHSFFKKMGHQNGFWFMKSICILTASKVVYNEHYPKWMSVKKNENKISHEIHVLFTPSFTWLYEMQYVFFSPKWNNFSRRKIQNTYVITVIITLWLHFLIKTLKYVVFFDKEIRHTQKYNQSLNLIWILLND